MTLWGAVLIVVARCLIRYLKTPRGGVTSETAAAFSIAPVTPPHETFGGGGAGGHF